jgi:hypothetical protein
VSRATAMINQAFGRHFGPPAGSGIDTRRRVSGR